MAEGASDGEVQPPTPTSPRRTSQSITGVQQISNTTHTRQWMTLNDTTGLGVYKLTLLNNITVIAERLDTVIRLLEGISMSGRRGSMGSASAPTEDFDESERPAPKKGKKGGGGEALDDVAKTEVESVLEELRGMLMDTLNVFVADHEGVLLQRRSANCPAQTKKFFQVLFNVYAPTEQEIEEGVDADPVVARLEALSQAQREEVFVALSKTRKKETAESTKSGKGRKARIQVPSDHEAQSSQDAMSSPAKGTRSKKAQRPAQGDSQGDVTSSQGEIIGSQGSAGGTRGQGRRGRGHGNVGNRGNVGGRRNVGNA